MILYHSQLFSMVLSLTYILHENRKKTFNAFSSDCSVSCTNHAACTVFFPDCSVSSSDLSVSNTHWSVSFPTSKEVGGGECTQVVILTMPARKGLAQRGLKTNRPTIVLFSGPTKAILLYD
jgi:hypothetical protein